MKTLIDAVTDMPDVGNCSLDLNKAIQLFDKYCVIVRGKDLSTGETSYRLFRIKAKAKNFKGLKVTISNEDALFLLNSLDLVEVQSGMFRNSTAFYHKDHASPIA